MSLTVPTQIADIRRKTQTGVTLLSGLSTDVYYFFVSSYDPWFRLGTSGGWDIIPATPSIINYDLDTRAGQKTIQDQLMGVKRIFQSDARLVIPRNNDIVGGAPQNIVPDSDIRQDFGASTDPTFYQKYVTSEGISSTINGDTGLYVYETLIGNTLPTDLQYQYSISSKINQNNPDLLFPFVLGNIPTADSIEQTGVGFKLLYKIQGADEEFVTSKYIPVSESGPIGSVQDRVQFSAQNGEVLTLKILSKGTGANSEFGIGGQIVNITNSNGVGFSGVTVTDPATGKLIRIDVNPSNRGYGYKEESGKNSVTIIKNNTTVLCDGTNGTPNIVPIFSPNGGFGSNLYNEMYPQNIMFFSKITSNVVDERSPFLSGMNGFTFGIMRAPNKFFTSLEYQEQYGTGYTAITIKNNGNQWSTITPPIAYDLLNSRVFIKVAQRDNAIVDFTQTTRIHSGELLKYTVNTDGSVTLYFVDTDISRLGWVLNGAYTVEFILRSELQNNTTDVNTSSNFTNVQLMGKVNQNIENGTGEIIYATRVEVSSDGNFDIPWIVQDNVMKEFRLVAPLC